VIRDGGIRTEEVKNCLFCGALGTPLHEGLSDHLFGVPGQWGFLQCTKCDLAWLSPRPIAADLSKAYKSYYTHIGDRNRKSDTNLLAHLRKKSKGGLYAIVSGSSELADGWGWRQLGRTLSRVPLLRERAAMGTMCLNGAKGGKLLDLGCGNGRFLALMRDAGWEVRGVEPDPAAAAKIAQQQFGIPVIVGTLEDAGFPGESFDAITLSHVVEHVHDPIALLSECRRVLKPEGRAVIVTPNLRSLGHQKFGSSWRGLEPPRHLLIFSLTALRVCCEMAGLRVQILRTSARAAGLVWQESEMIKRRKESSSLDRGQPSRARRLFFNLHEDGLCRASEEVGEEILLIAGAGGAGLPLRGATPAPEDLRSRYPEL
jgi:2-polyprenyl-3-methyl-5-hydroxy-6-metoxy-1,4-benzoquinol methylase